MNMQENFGSSLILSLFIFLLIAIPLTFIYSGSLET